MSRAPHLAAEGHVYHELAGTPEDRPFVRTLLVTWLGLSAATAGAALLLDPLGTFGTGLARPLLWRDRDEKAEAFLRREPQPQALVLGSSHMMKMDPECLEELTGLPAFNFAVSAARVEDDRAIFSFATAAGARLARLLVGVDPEAFHSARDEMRLLVSSVHLRDHAGVPLPSPWRNAGPSLLGLEAASAGLRSVRALVRRERGDGRGRRFRGDGLLLDEYWEEGIQSDEASLDERIRRNVSRFRNWYRDFDGLHPPRIALFRELLGEARARRVAVDAVMTPLHPSLAAAFGPRSAVTLRRAETDALLRDLDREGLLRYHVRGGLRDFGGEETEFYDGHHMTGRNSTRLLRRVYGKDAGCAVQ